MKHYISKNIISEEYANIIINSIHNDRQFCPYYLTKTFAYKAMQGFDRHGEPVVYIYRCAMGNYLNCMDNWTRCSEPLYWSKSDGRFTC